MSAESPANQTKLKLTHRWQVATLQGKWTGEEGVGGSRNDPDAYAKNPQFLVNILEPGTRHTDVLLSIFYEL